MDSTHEHLMPMKATWPQRLDVSAETLFTVRSASNAEISPDGQQVVFLVGEWLPEQSKQRNRLWIVPTNGGEPHPLTHGLRSDRSPSWSPDGKYIAFASKVEGNEKQSKKAQLCIVSTDGKEFRQVCTLPNGVSDVRWSPDGACIAFLSLEGEDTGDDPLILQPGRGQHQQLWTVYVDDSTPIAITPDKISIWSYVWSPDSKQFAVYYAPGPEETDWYRGQIGVVAAGGGAVRQISHLKRQAYALTWSPDSQRIAYISGEWSDPDRGGGDLFIHTLTHTLADDQPRNLTPNITWSPAWCRWFPDGQRLLCAGWDGFSSRVAVVDAQSGEISTLSTNFTLGERFWPHLSTTPDMSSFAATHSEQHPYDVWLGQPTEGNDKPAIAWKRLTRLNPIAEETLLIAPTEHLRYESADGWEIEATITWPLHHNKQTLPPLIVHVHGGPSGVWLNDWENYRAQALAAEGFAVLRPNIRGSMGRGVAFADAVVGDMGGKDFQDIMHGVDHLVERNLVDRERIGIMGWSYGGFMTAWAVTQTNRFKAACMGAGISDYHSFHAQTNIQDWDMRFLGKINGPIHPLTHPEIYRERSPITHAHNVTTPTLIVHGEKDACVPLNQAYAFYRALKARKVPVELVVYPREGHGLNERSHLLDYMQRTIRWFKHHLS